MPRIRFPKDLKSRATRALGNLKKPGIGAVCFWCGHPYRIGNYSPETESNICSNALNIPKKVRERSEIRLIRIK